MIQIHKGKFTRVDNTAVPAQTGGERKCGGRKMKIRKIPMNIFHLLTSTQNVC